MSSSTKILRGYLKGQSCTFQVQKRLLLNYRRSHQVPSCPFKHSGADWQRRTNAMPPVPFLLLFFSELLQSTHGKNSIVLAAHKILPHFGGSLNQVHLWLKNLTLTLHGLTYSGNLKSRTVSRCRKTHFKHRLGYLVIFNV